jgi:hypothetical protein
MKRLLIIIALLSAVGVCQSPSRFGASQLPRGTTAGQIWQSNGSSADPTFVDPIVSFNFTNLLPAGTSANSIATGSAVRLSTLNASGTLYVNFASVIGSSITCTIQLINYDSLGNAINNGPAIALVNPVVNGVVSFPVNPVSGLKQAAQMSATFNCGTFPTGTLSIDFVPSVTTFTAFGIPNLVGCYAINGRTGTYAGQVAGVPLWSMRWGSSTLVGLVMKVSVIVETTVAATVVGPAERELIGSTSNTVADTGGTAVTLTNNKLDPNYPASAVSDMRFGAGTLTAGTRTLNANPFSSVISWLPLLMTGIDLGGSCGNALLTGTAVAWTCMGGTGPIEMWNATNNQNMPIVLRANTGLHIRIGKDAQPSTATQRTMVNIMWCEATSYNAAQ